MRPLFIRRAELLDRSSLDLSFSELLDSASAQQNDHYLLAPSGMVEQVRVDSVRSDLVHLELSGLQSAGTIYTVTVRDIWNLSLDRTIVPGWGDVASFTLPAPGLSGAIVVPSPFMPSRDGTLRFINLPEATSARIFTLAGELIWEGQTEEAGSIVWPGENQSGRALASGIYIYLLTTEGEVKHGKLVLIN
jgi:hypothetical protein